MAFATQAVHLGNAIDSGSGAIRTPLVMANSYALPEDPTGIDWSDTNGLDHLITEALPGNDFNIQAVYNANGDQFAATVQATGLELDGPNNNATQYSATMELSQGVPTQS